jgi:GNAT superfamily N-acetyltransferase
MEAIIIRPLTPADRAAWEPLWLGYQAFYKVQIPPATTDETWRRFHDPALPVHALGAYAGDALVGITHYIFHYSCWTSEQSCYLQDLFADPAARGRGVGRALIEAVYAAARAAGSSSVYWLTHETNAEAMVLYNKVAERTGFTRYRKMLG